MPTETSSDTRYLFKAQIERSHLQLRRQIRLRQIQGLALSLIAQGVNTYRKRSRLETPERD